MYQSKDCWVNDIVGDVNSCIGQAHLRFFAGFVLFHIKFSMKCFLHLCLSFLLFVLFPWYLSVFLGMINFEYQLDFFVFTPLVNLSSIIKNILECMILTFIFTFSLLSFYIIYIFQDNKSKIVTRKIKEIYDRITKCIPSKCRLHNVYVHTIKHGCLN